MPLWRLACQNLQGRLAGWQPRKEMMMQLKSKGSLLAEFPLLLKSSVFFYLKSSSDWMRTTHIMEANLRYSKSTNLNANSILKILP